MRTLVAVLGLLPLMGIAAWTASTFTVSANDRMDQCLDVKFEGDTRDHGKGVSDQKANFSSLCSDPIALTVCYIDYKGAAQGGTFTCDFVEDIKPKQKNFMSRYMVLGKSYYYEACKLQDTTCIGYAKDFYAECNGKFCQY